MNLFRKFLLDDPTPREIASVILPTGSARTIAEAGLRIEEPDSIAARIAAAKDSLGEKYLCHASNHVQRRAETENA
jgi:hypothetical protein